MSSPRGGDRREVAALAVCLGLSGLLFAFGGHLDTAWVARAEGVLLWPANQVRGFVEAVTRQAGENEKLRQEVTRLRAERALLLRAVAEADRVRRALRFAEPRGPVLLAAQVTAVRGEPWPLLFELSVGSAEGVRIEQPVVAPEGLVGVVTGVDAHASRAALLTDPNVAVACEVLPGGARGVLRFRAEERPGLYLSFVPLTDTVRVGQEVATSGLSARFPEGLPVGTVARVGRDASGLVQEIEVRPSAPLFRLREVFVVVDVERLEPWSAQAADSVEAAGAAPSSSPAAGGPPAVPRPDAGPDRGPVSPGGEP